MLDFETQPSNTDVQQLINAIDHTRRQHDANTLLALMTKISGHTAVIWGEDIIGFGQYHYRYKTGREGDWPILAFSSDHKSISIYVMPGFENYEKLLNKMGSVKHTNFTLTLHKLSDIHMPALQAFIQQVFDDMQKLHG